ncbi:hypothetical protein [Streptomyces sp. GbtcB6]|uniref:hypothetical protein n=1 Tax=Streptomyces sp. GbtcB6 TaxID=2824751 RepID=UPI001C3118E3|nr:hypothetical protein [Streptomyces sp. GbtcB6]
MTHGPAEPPAGADRPDAWPFVITRTASHDFQVVVGPRFLAETRTHGLLASVAGGEVSDDGAYLREYRDRGGRSLWLLYRVVYLTGADVGRDVEYVRNHGRRTPLMEGVVRRDRPRTGEATRELFHLVHGLCADVVKDFYDADSDTFGVHPADEIEVPEEGAPLRCVIQDTYHSQRSIEAALPGRRRPSGDRRVLAGPVGGPAAVSVPPDRGRDAASGGYHAGAGRQGSPDPGRQGPLGRGSPRSTGGSGDHGDVGGGRSEPAGGRLVDRPWGIVCALTATVLILSVALLVVLLSSV